MGKTIQQSEDIVGKTTQCLEERNNCRHCEVDMQSKTKYCSKNGKEVHDNEIKEIRDKCIKKK